MITSISVLGLGLMGRSMARLLGTAGWNVSGWNRSQLSEDLTQDIPLYHSLEDAAHADACLLMVTDSQAVDTLLGQLEPNLCAGQVVLDMGTSEPDRSKAHAKRLAAKGIGWVDAPVSGGPEGAVAGTLAIMAGGTEVDFARVQPFLDALGGTVTHVGGPGMGHALKVINQLIVGLVIEAVAEGLTLAEKAGIDPILVQQALKDGFADSKILQIHGTRMINRSYVPGGKVKSQLKDLQMALDMATTTSTKLPHLESTTALYETLMTRGDGELDHSALHKMFWS